MTKYTNTEILNRIEQLAKEQPWNHRIELPYDITTADVEQVSHGKNMVKWSRIETFINTIDIKGKRVFDVGCNEGFFSLKLKESGAKEVVGVDADELRIKKAKFVSEALETSNISYEIVDIFDKSIEKYGHFDFVLCMGFLHRVPYPYKAIQQLAKISDTILFEWKSLKEGDFNSPIMKFCGGVSKDSNKYSGLYWLPSVRCVTDILKASGFVHNLVIDDPTWRRAIVISSRVDNPVFKNKNLISINKFFLLKKMTRSYLGSIFRMLKDDKIKWL